MDRNVIRKSRRSQKFVNIRSCSNSLNLFPRVLEGGGWGGVPGRHHQRHHRPHLPAGALPQAGGPDILKSCISPKMYIIFMIIKHMRQQQPTIHNTFDRNSQILIDLWWINNEDLDDKMYSDFCQWCQNILLPNHPNSESVIIFHLCKSEGLLGNNSWE